MATPEVKVIGVLCPSNGGTDRINVNGVIGNPIGSIAIELEVPFSLIEDAHNQILEHYKKEPKKTREVVVNVDRKVVKLNVK